VKHHRVAKFEPQNTVLLGWPSTNFPSRLTTESPDNNDMWARSHWPAEPGMQEIGLAKTQKSEGRRWRN